MNCKRCGNEIVGEIQRYCNDCKRELNGEPREKKGFTKKFRKENKVEETKTEPVETVKQVEVKQTQIKQEEVKQTEVKQSEMKQEKVKQEETKQVEEKRKRSLLATIGYILFVIVIMAVVFLGSIMIGFSIGPFLSF